MKYAIWPAATHFTVLAPMEGVTDVVFRQVIARVGRPDFFFTEFTNVSSFASDKGRHDALERLDIAGRSSQIVETVNRLHPEYNMIAADVPIVAQIWGKNPMHFAELASALASMGFQGLDINMGCPDRHVNKAGGGAAMIRTPDLAVECIKQAQAHTTLPVSVKTRLGFTYVEEYQVWLPLLLQQNLAALTVHLRTRKEMSKVAAHFELIPKIIQLRDQLAPQTKIIFNGDIRDYAHCQELWRQYPKIDGLMIGRGVFDNPWCFNQETEAVLDNARRFELFRYHLDLFDARAAELAARGSRYPYEPLKHFIKVYINGFSGSRELRAALMVNHSTTELRATLADYLATHPIID